MNRITFVNLSLIFVTLMALMAFMPQSFTSSTDPPAIKPLSFKSVDYPKEMIVLKPSENSWLQKNDVIYSVYQNNGSFYACWDVVFDSKNLIIKSFTTDGLIPVKTGLSHDDVTIWALWRNNSMRLLKLSTYASGFYTYGIATLTDDSILVNDNLYYSLDPVWSGDSAYKILTPPSGRFVYFRDIISYRNLMPRYTTGAYKLEVCDGTATVINPKNFNETQIKFLPADISRGYVIIIIHATALSNSHSSDTFRQYKLYWK